MRSGGNSRSSIGVTKGRLCGYILLTVVIFFVVYSLGSSSSQSASSSSSTSSGGVTNHDGMFSPPNGNAEHNVGKRSLQKQKKKTTAEDLGHQKDGQEEGNKPHRYVGSGGANHRSKKGAVNRKGKH